MKTSPLKRRTELRRTELQRKPSKAKRTPTRVQGYDYESFCQGIADRDGADCCVRRNVSLPPELLSCDGRLDGHHLLSKAWLKGEFPDGAFSFSPIGDGWVWLEGEHAWHWSLGSILSDSRNGISVCRKHHDLLENARITVARADLPESVEAFAAELGVRAVARLERCYGYREAAV